MRSKILLTALLAGSFFMANAQEKAEPKAEPEDTEVWGPEPAVVTPGKTTADAPSDAIILFDGSNENEFVLTSDRTKPADWTIADGILTVNKASGNIETKRKFNSFQLHIEWRIPATITGSGQARGNSGVFLASTGKGDDGYELQVLDAYQNKTYVDGMAGSIYKQFIPLANPAKPPGEWETYDVIWTAPVFNEDGSLKSPARATILFNGVLVQNNVELKGPTLYIGKPAYIKHGMCPIKLQAHGDKSAPISFRNIWVREL